MDAKEGGLTGKAGIWPYVQLSVNQEATTFSGGTSLELTLCETIYIMNTSLKNRYDFCSGRRCGGVLFF